MSNIETPDEMNAGMPTNCGWCTAILGQTNHHSGAVCKKCYGLLSRAGVHRGEIFARIDPPSGTSGES